MRIFVLGLLFIFSLILPGIYLISYSPHQKLSDTVYKTVDIKQADKRSHERLIYEETQNLRKGRISQLSVIDELTPSGSAPVFQYYSVGLYWVTAVLNLVLDDVIYSYVFVMWLGCLAFVFGVFFWASDLSESTSTALLITFIAVTVPEYATTFIEGAFSQCIGIALIPFTTAVWSRYVRRQKSSSGSEGVKDFALFFATTALLTLTLLVHNINVLLGVTFFGLPVVICTHRLLGQRNFPWKRAMAPVVIAILCSLFYWVPVLTEHKTFNLLHNINWEYGREVQMIRTIFSPLPWGPEGFARTASHQIGWCFIALTLLLFTKRNIHVFIIEALMLILSISGAAWDYILPSIYKVVQYSGRLVLYFPVFLAFQVRNIKRSLYIFFCILGVAQAIIFLPVKYERFATNIDFGIPLAPDRTNYLRSQALNVNVPSVPGGLKISATQVLKTQGQWPVRIRLPLAGTAEASSATYIVKPLLHGRSVDGLFAQIVVLYPQQKARGYDPVPLNGGVGLFSVCATGGQDAEIIIGGQVAPSSFDSVEVRLAGEPGFMSILSQDGVHEANCAYKFDNPAAAYTFKVAPNEILQGFAILPIFYSPYNSLKDQKGQEIQSHTGSFLDGRGLPYTVIQLPPGVDEITVSFSSKNRLRFIPIAILGAVIIYGMYLIFKTHRHDVRSVT